MAHPEHRSTDDLGGTGVPAVATAEDDLLVDLREDALLTEERALIDLRGPEPLVTFEPVPDATIHRRWLLLVMLAILNALDLVTTRLVLDAGGTEGNPLMAPIIHHPVAPILVKTAGIAMVACLLRACPPKSRLVDAGLVGVTLGYTIVVCWNMLNLATIG
ncbi:MAG: DUF5658 family protein [Actinomycetota bacterium]